jgi:hypothetical protein
LPDGRFISQSERPFTPFLLRDNICAVKSLSIILLFAAIGLMKAQEVDVLVPARLAKVDVVVVGELHGDFKFPWFDGWNERGHIQVDRVLKGDIGNVHSLPFAWERDFHQGWCLTRPEWRGAVGKPGIWLLSRDGNRYRAPDLFIGFLDPAKHLDQVVRALAEIQK